MTNKFREEYPITSYSLTTALFFILAGQDALHRRNETPCYPKETKALEQAIYLARTEAGDMKGRGIYNLNPEEADARWMDDKDVVKYAEEGRCTARAILVFIKHLALHHYVVSSYWEENLISCLLDHNDRNSYPAGKTEYLCCICDRLLSRLEESHFYVKT